MNGAECFLFAIILMAVYAIGVVTGIGFYKEYQKMKEE